MNLSELFKKPLVLAGIGLILGLIIGLVIGWGIMPVSWVDAPVNLLRQDLQEDYLRMSIDSFRVNNDEALALKRYEDLGDNAPALLAAINAKPGKIDQNFIILYGQMISRNKTVLPESGQPAETAPSNLGVSAAVIIGALVAIGGVVGAAFFVVRKSAQQGVRSTSPKQVQEFDDLPDEENFIAQSDAPPVAHYVTTYVLGDDLFDDSFSIDSPSGEFLGECGVGISETIGVGDPKKVTAFEVWMFDKNDIQTVTKVLMSPYSFNDNSYRSKLEAKGELVNIDSQKQIVMETQTLHMVATVSDMQYGQGAQPNGSFFDKVTIELAIWSKV